MMSGSTGSFPSIDELRRRFAVWGLAIFGSLYGSGNVRLESSAWGAEDPPTEAKSQSEKKTNANSDGATPVFDRAVFQQLLKSNDFEAASKMVDEALAIEPGGANLYMSYLLANAMLTAKDPAGVARMESVAKLSSEAITADASSQVRSAFAMSHQSLAAKLASEKQYAPAIELLQAAHEKLEAHPGGPQGSTVMSMLVSLLMREGRVEEAKALVSLRLDRALAAVKENANSSTRGALGIAFSQFSSTLGSKFADDVQKAYETIEPMLREAVESESGSVTDYGAYQSVQTGLAMAKADSDSAQAMKILEATKELADNLAERLDDADKKKLNSVQLSLRSTESRLKSKLLQQSLIGQPAPEFDIEAVVNMPKFTWAELKGKVVLIDFWAVWCGPCIATFPHLQDWKKEYGDKGLVIVGVTKQYGYKWDKEKNEEVTDKEASLETELEMLEEFRKAHQLEHGFVVTPQGSDYSKQFGVTGIPQAVLVDQNGVIQLIRVGSGEKNAEELEAKIKSLLGI